MFELKIVVTYQASNSLLTVAFAKNDLL